MGIRIGKTKGFEIWSYFFFAIFLGVFSVIIAKIFVIQILNGDEYAALAKRQFSWHSVIEPRRGEILLEDKDGNKIAAAINEESYILYVNPKEIENPAETLKTLKNAAVLKNGGNDIENKITDKTLAYLILEKNITRNQKEQIESLQLNGVYFKEDDKRRYPLGTFAATTIGFVGIGEDGGKEGKYGVEKYFEDILAGSPGFLSSENEALRLPENGARIILTIDPKIQQETERVLSESIARNKAQGGTAIVMNPKTGEILALADLPGFDPNRYSSYQDFSRFRNKAVENYEPGSVMKAFTIAAAFNEKKLSPEDTYEDKGFVKANGYTIKNYDEKGHGTITIRHGLEKSYNTVAMHALSLIGNRALTDYLESFGFNKKTSITLPGAGSGDMRNLLSEDAKDVNFLTASFGQGIGATPIQLLRAFSAFANNGNMVEPRLIKRIEFPDGRVKQSFKEEISTPIGREALEKLTSVLISVVENGSGKPSRMQNYILAGKTGTAQIPKVGAPGYEPDDFIQTFIEYGPVSNPQFLILTKMERPGLIGLRFAETTVVPIARDIASFIINYYNIPPDRKSEKTAAQ